MNREKLIQIVGAFALFFVIFVILVFYEQDDYILLLILAVLVIGLAGYFLSELYLRIQHNTDRKFKDLNRTFEDLNRKMDLFFGKLDQGRIYDQQNRDKIDKKLSEVLFFQEKIGQLVELAVEKNLRAKRKK